MKVELLEIEREHLVDLLKYNVELIRDYIITSDHPTDLAEWGRELVRTGEILEKLKKAYEPVPNLGTKSTKKKRKTK